MKQSLQTPLFMVLYFLYNTVLFKKYLYPTSASQFFVDYSTALAFSCNNFYVWHFVRPTQMLSTRFQYIALLDIIFSLEFVVRLCYPLFGFHLRQNAVYTYTINRTSVSAIAVIGNWIKIDLAKNLINFNIKLLASLHFSYTVCLNKSATNQNNQH